MEKKKYHHGNLKAALITAGLEILEESGLAALTLRACAERAGVSHAAPKNHFGSRAGLVTAIATEGFLRHAAIMRAGISKQSSRKDKLRAAAQGYVTFALSYPHLFEMMFSPNFSDFNNDELKAAARDSYAVLAEVSAGLNWDKAGLPDAQQRTEYMIWSFVHGFAHLTLSCQFDAPGNAPMARYGPLDIIPEFGYLTDAKPPKTTP